LAVIGLKSDAGLGRMLYEEMAMSVDFGQMAGRRDALRKELAELEKVRAELQAELTELETAIRVVRQYETEPKDEGVDATPQSSNGKDVGLQGDSERNRAPTLAGTRIAEAANIILTERGGDTPVHFTEIAQEAVSRGYQGREGSRPGSVADSFYHVMRRHPDRFEQVEGRTFRLNHSGVPLGGARMPKPRPRKPKKKSSIDKVEELLREKGPMQRHQIEFLLKLPKGTLARALNLQYFGRDAEGRWHIRDDDQEPKDR
jgi:hypothetical protein